MIQLENLRFSESDGLIPVVVQDTETKQVLMLAYMNREAVQQTILTKKVTFFSRKRNEIWVKGETSGHFLQLVSLTADCDEDTLLCQVIPTGPTCHTGTKTCWKEEETTAFGILEELENSIAERLESPVEGSYVSSLKAKGINKIAQKVGEEGVEVVIEALGNNRELFIDESADLLFHFLILLQAKGESLKTVTQRLKERRK